MEERIIFEKMAKTKDKRERITPDPHDVYGWYKKELRGGRTEYSSEDHHYYVGVVENSLTYLACVCFGSGYKDIIEFRFTDGKPAGFVGTSQFGSNESVNNYFSSLFRYQSASLLDEILMEPSFRMFQSLAKVLERNPTLQQAIYDAVDELKKHKILKRLMIQNSFPGSLSDLEKMTGKKYSAMLDKSDGLVKLVAQEESSIKAYELLAQVAYGQGADALVHTTSDVIVSRVDFQERTSVRASGYAVKEIK